MADEIPETPIKVVKMYLNYLSLIPQFLEIKELIVEKVKYIKLRLLLSLHWQGYCGCHDDRITNHYCQPG